MDETLEYKVVFNDLGQKRYECLICGNLFTKTCDVPRHVKYMHKSANSIFPCSICNATFTKEGFVKSHIKYVHEGKKKEPKKSVKLVKEFKPISEVDENRKERDERRAKSLMTRIFHKSVK